MSSRYNVYMSILARLLGLEPSPVLVTESRDVTDLIPGRTESTTITEDSLLHTINVYRAVHIISQAVSQLTLDVMRGEEVLPRPSLLRRPDIRLNSLSSFLKLTATSLALTGNAYWTVKRNARNEAFNITVMNPHQCVLRPDGRLQVAGQEQWLNPSEFQHLGLLRIPGLLEALGPIQAARMELTGTVMVTRYGSEFFDTGDIPSGVLKTDQVLSKSQANDYKVIWQERKTHEVAVLGQGLDYKPILLSPKDAQFLETRQFDTTAIARLFGIPAHMFMASVEGSSLTYFNMEQADLSFVRWTLMDYLREMEEAFSAVLPSTQTARFNLDALIRPDTKTRYESHKLGIEAGWLTKDEVRKIEGLPPLAGSLSDSGPDPEQDN